MRNFQVLLPDSKTLGRRTPYTIHRKYWPTPHNPLIPANAGTQIINAVDQRIWRQSHSGAAYDLGPGIRRDERKKRVRPKSDWY
jgi:hypothetical protein